ncbi:MAG: hypothetical protein JXR83_02150 [Deltaproteobacteria bacterium]|nr:hypothetical protein [Deltaproteobacteria bacterium]
MSRVSMLLVALPLALALASCSQTVVGGGTALERYDVELREKINTCNELDPQVARETIFIERFGKQGVLHLGADLAFPVKIEGGAISGRFLEADHTTVGGRHVVCKRMTAIDLAVKEGAIDGTYDRKRRQECLLEAKPCFTTWSITGKLIED